MVVSQNTTATITTEIILAMMVEDGKIGRNKRDLFQFP
jgi:hypothetical protein